MYCMGSQALYSFLKAQNNTCHNTKANMVVTKANILQLVTPAKLAVFLFGFSGPGLPSVLLVGFPSARRIIQISPVASELKNNLPLLSQARLTGRMHTLLA